MAIQITMAATAQTPASQKNSLNPRRRIGHGWAFERRTAALLLPACCPSTLFMIGFLSMSRPSNDSLSAYISEILPMVNDRRRIIATDTARHIQAMGLT
jgi:hypothetical protein